MHPYEVYKNSLARIKEGKGGKRDYDLMEELTEKENFKAPKKMTIWESDASGTYRRKVVKVYCPECGYPFADWGIRRCPVCGQTMMWYWDDDEEKGGDKE